MRKRLENSVAEAKTGTLECAGARYGFGRNKMRAIAEDAGAVIKIGKTSVSILQSLTNIWMLYQASK